MVRKEEPKKVMKNKKPVNRNSNNRFDGILNKSAKLLARKGYHGTSMRDLAETTGHSVSGLYHYLDGKGELLFKINERGFSSLLEKAARVLEQQVSPEERLKEVISNHIGFFSSHMSEMRVMMFGTHDIDSRLSRIIGELKDDYASIVRQVVSDYIKSQSDKRFTEQEISRKTYLLFGMMNWIYGWYSKNEHGSADELAGDIYDTFTQGCIGEG